MFATRNRLGEVSHGLLGLGAQLLLPGQVHVVATLPNSNLKREAGVELSLTSLLPELPSYEA